MTIAPLHPSYGPLADAARAGPGDRRSATSRLPALAAAATAVFSVVYAVGYLVVAPPAQRGTDVDAALRSLVTDPAGMRIAAGCLVAAGITSGLAVAALRVRLRRPGDSLLAWATIAGVAGGLASAAHGFGEIVTLQRVAERYVEGDAATRAAAELVKAVPSAVDPLGLATFALAGLVTLVFAHRLRAVAPRLALVGLVYGLDLVVLFVVNAAGIDGAVLATGGLASLLVGPAWWLGVASHLRSVPAPALVSGRCG
jgi:hypothetical protein